MVDRCCVYCGRREYLQLRLIESSGVKFTASVCRWCRGVETRNAKKRFLESLKPVTVTDAAAALAAVGIKGE